MEVAMMTQSCYPNDGGVTERVRYLSRVLLELGCRVTIIISGASSYSETYTIRSGRNVLVPANGALVNGTVGLNLRANLFRILKPGDFDLIRIHSPLEPTLPLPALAAAKTLKIPLIGTFHTSAAVSSSHEVFSTLLLKYASRIIFFARKAAPSDLPTCYHSCHIFCSIQLGRESFGIMLLEAMAADRPVVATDIEGYREIVRYGIDDILVKPGFYGCSYRSHPKAV